MDQWKIVKMDKRLMSFTLQIQGGRLKIGSRETDCGHWRWLGRM
jgi:hypothetical protein